MPSGKRIALALTADGEVDLIRSMVTLLDEVVDRVIIAEGTRTFAGRPREVIGDGWAGLLGISPDRLISVVVELPDSLAPNASLRLREALQRAAIGLGTRDLAPDDIVVAVDSDEFIDPEWLRAHAAHIDEPRRLRLIALYGGIDRRAPDWHCCPGHLTIPVGQWPPRETGFLVPGGVVGQVRHIDGSGVGAWRVESPLFDSSAAGWHLLHVLPAGGDPARKLTRQAHEWDSRLDGDRLREALCLGVHPYGWWGVTAMPVPDALAPMAARHPEVVLGPLPDDAERRAWQLEALREFGSLTAGEA